MVVHKLSERERVRNIRLGSVRRQIEAGWNQKQLLHFCEMKFDVSRVTALSYINEAAEKYREKYAKEQKNK